MKTPKEPKDKIVTISRSFRYSGDFSDEDCNPEIDEKLVSVGSGLLFRRHVWKNVPSDLMVSEFTPAGSRLIYTEEPATRFFLKHYIPAGAHNPESGLPCPHGAVLVTCRASDYVHTLNPESVMVHNSKQVREELPDSVKHYSGGHRQGTAAAEKAALRELKRQQRQAKRDEKDAKRQAKTDAKQAKIDARDAKRKARFDKAEAKRLKKERRLAKKAKKEKQKKSVSKTADKFFDLKTTVKRKLAKK